MSPARPDRDFEGIRVVTADWPIVSVEFPTKTPSDAAVVASLAYIESLMGDAARAHTKIFVINDLTPVREVISAAHRKIASEWMKRTAALARASTVGSANVTPSAFLRGLLTALFLIQPSATPTLFVATRAEAMLRGIRLLDAEGMRVPPHLIAGRDPNARRVG